MGEISWSYLLTICRSSKLFFRLLTHWTNWLKYKIYLSSHIDLTPQVNNKNDIDYCSDALDSVLEAAAKTSTPQETTKLQIKQQQQIVAINATFYRIRKQELSQRLYVEKLSPTSTKHPLRRAYPNLRSPTETDTPIRNSSASWAHIDEDRAVTYTPQTVLIYHRFALKLQESRS